jgi:hypothetical protein
VRHYTYKQRRISVRSARALVVLRVLFVRIGKPEIVDRPLVLQLGGKRAVIACNHVGLGG